MSSGNSWICYRENAKPMRRNEPIPSSKRKAEARDRALPVPLSRLPLRSSEARTKALHVKAAMVRDSNLNLYATARSFGVKPSVVRKYFGSSFN